MKENTMEFKSNSNWEKKHPPDELIQMARIKFVPKIHVWIPKSPIIECDHMKSGLGFFPYSKIFGKIKQWLENNQISLFELKFKSFEF